MQERDRELHQLGVNIDADPTTRCWNWLGTVTDIPTVFWYGTNRSVRRVVWEHIRGRIPNGVRLHPTCGNRRCVYPGHMKQIRGKRGKVRARSADAELSHIERGIARLDAANAADAASGYETFSDRSTRDGGTGSDS